MENEPHDRDPGSFGALLRKLRLARGLTQEELAERAGLSVRGLSDLERGARQRARPETFALLADALGLDPGERACLDRALHLWPARRPRGVTPIPTSTKRDESRCSPTRHNLPAPVSSFVGRERELAEVERSRKTTRLLTLSGTGGSGKTRLALHLAAAGREEYPDGVWLVELASLGDPALVPPTVAAALGVREEPDRPILATLASALHDQRLLLLLDNCEHLVDACAQLAEHLLAACPRLQILATSREALRIDGETIYLVPPLALPDPSRAPDPDELARTDAIRLFLDRAASVQPAFALTAENAAAVAQICRQLDGLPLAIELAAAYLRGLSVAQLAARLDQRLDLLRRGGRTADPRHQTLRALIDWSYNLLGEQERMLFARLAAFAGGFTLPAAEAISAGEVAAPEVLQLLVRLVDTSLVVADVDGERYHLLETVREYAGERLEASGLADAIRGRHAAYYLALAEDAASRYGGPEHDAWRRQFVVERDNLRAALAWLRDHDPPRALRLAIAHDRFWYVSGSVAEGRAWLETLLARMSAHTPLRATALIELAQLLELQRDMGLALSYCEESLAISRKIDDRQAMLQAVRFLGVLARGMGDFERSRALLEETRVLARELGDRHEEIRARFNLGFVAMSERDYGRARLLLGQGLAQSREVGYRFGAVATLGRLGALARLEGDFPRARALLEEGIAAARAIGHRPAAGSFLASLGNLDRCEGNYAAARAHLADALREIGLPFLNVTCLVSFGVLAIQTGATARGVRLIAAATREDPTLVGMHMPEIPIDCQDNLPRAHAALGEAEFARAWGEGRAMTLEQAVAYALEEDPDA